MLNAVEQTNHIVMGWGEGKFQKIAVLNRQTSLLSLAGGKTADFNALGFVPALRFREKKTVSAADFQEVSGYAVRPAERHQKIMKFFAQHSL